MTAYREMFKGIVGDRNTKLLSPYIAGMDTYISVVDTSVFPPAPNYASVRMPNKSCLVTVLYTGKTASTLTGVSVVEADTDLGLSALYPAGSKVYWSLTRVLLDSIIDNVVKLIDATGYSSKESYGVVKIGDGISVDNGVISVSADVGDYNALRNKPKINGVELVGNLSLSDIGIASAEELDEKITYDENSEYFTLGKDSQGYYYKS